MNCILVASLACLAAAAAAAYGAAAAPIEWSNPYLNMSTLIVAVDVTMDIPFAGGDYPFVMLGSITDVPFSNSCPAKKTPFVPYYSCATLSAADMIPFSCKDSGHSGKFPSFSVANLRSMLYAVQPSALFVENGGSGPELSMIGDTSSVHRHYDRYPLQSGIDLHNGECFVTNRALTQCTIAAYERLPLTSMQEQPDLRRLHVAKIVPFHTFPTTMRMTYHFQYRATQMQLDCPNAVRVTTIFSESGYVLGFSYRFTLTVGVVRSKDVIARESREFDVHLLFNSLTGSYVSYGIFVISTTGAYYTVDVRAADNPLAAYSSDGSAAKLTLSLLLTLTTIGQASTVALPTNALGWAALDALFLPDTNCVPFTVVQILSMSGDKRYCPSASVCRYIITLETAMTVLASDGSTFMTRSAGGLQCQRMMTFRFPYARCTRNGDGSVRASCTPVLPMQLEEVQLNLVKYVYPRTTRATVQRARALVLLDDAPTYDDLVAYLCQTGVNHTICADSEPSHQSRMGDTLAILFAWNDIDQLSGARNAPTLFIDESTLQFQVSGYTLGDASIGSFVRTLSPTSPQWPAFRASWYTFPRTSSPAFHPRLPIVRERAGVDGLTLPVSSIKEHIDLEGAFVIQTLIVSAFVTPRMARAPAGVGRTTASGDVYRRFTRSPDDSDVADGMFVQTSRTFVAFTSQSCMMTPTPAAVRAVTCPPRNDTPTYITIVLLLATLASPWFLWNARRNKVCK